MFTFLNRYILVVFLLTPTCLVAQNRQDTLSAGYTDTPAEKNSDSLYSDESADDNLSLPVADSSSPAPKKLREVPAKQVKLFRDDPEYAYANDPEYWRKEPYREPGVFFRILFSSTLRWALLTFVALLILYGIYRLAKENNFISTERFRKLQSNSIELRTAQLSLIDTQDKLINALFRAKLAEISIRLLAGELSAQPGN